MISLSGFQQYHECMGNFREDFPLLSYITSLPADFPCVFLHRHDEFELIYVREGSGLVSVDLEVFPVKKGDFLIVLPGQLHSVFSNEGASLTYQNILFPLSMLMGREPDVCTREFFQPLLDGMVTLPCLISSSESWYDAFRSSVEELNVLGSFYPAGYSLAMKSRLFHLFYILVYYAAKPRPRTRPQKSVDKIRFILDFLSENYTRKLGIPEIAEASGLSESHFIRFFKSAAGVTLTDYLLDYRLVIAGLHLRVTDAKIQDIAKDCGFISGSYFNHSFREKYHMTPSEYRKKTTR